MERVQQTDLKEFWALTDLRDEHLSDRVAEYQHYYNWDRIHGSLGKTPMDLVVELSPLTPFWDDIERIYDPSKEFIRIQDYLKDVKLLNLKLSM